MLVLALDTTTRGGSLALVRDGGVLEMFAGDADANPRHAPAGRHPRLSRAPPGRHSRNRPLRRRRRAGVVHRTADRHRDHPGAGLRQRPFGRGGIGARRARRGGRCGRRRRSRGGRPEGGVDGCPAGRGLRLPLPPPGQSLGAAVRASGEQPGRHAGGLGAGPGRCCRRVRRRRCGGSCARARRGCAPEERGSSIPCRRLPRRLPRSPRRRRSEAGPPHRIRPLYVRRPDAELARERRQAGAS